MRSLLDEFENRINTDAANEAILRQRSAITLARSFLDRMAAGDLQHAPRQTLDGSTGVSLLAEISKDRRKD
jgi:hypothetical protein